MTKINKGLGRGFEALIPGNFDASILVDEEERIQKLDVNNILPNKKQPRQDFDEQALQELASSLKTHGMLQPIVVTHSDENDKYHIVAGERRWRAAKKAGLSHLPAIVRSAQELEQLEIALVENVQRVDLSPLEQATSVQRLHDQFNIDYEDIAKRLGKAVTTVLNTVRLLRLPLSAQQALRSKQISEGHARAILALKNDSSRDQLLALIIAKRWSVRQAEQYATAHKKGIKNSLAAQKHTQTTTLDTKKLSAALNTPVTLRRLAKGGKLEIRYKTDTQLKQIIKRMLAKRS